MTLDPHVLDLHADLAAEAFDGIAFQSAALSRFLRRGDDIAALKTYDRIAGLFKEFAVPEMRVIRSNLEEPDSLSAEASAEWRADRDSSLPRKTARAA